MVQKTLPVLALFLLLIITSCGSKSNGDITALASHIELCDSLELTGDSLLLRQEARKLSGWSDNNQIPIRITLYEANAEYNQGHFKKTLQLLDKAAGQPGWNDFTEGQARALFLKGRCYQKQKDYETAMPIYEQLIAMVPSEEGKKKTAHFMNEGLLQLMYCYVFATRIHEGAAYFKRIYEENTLWLPQNYPRNIEITLAYALYLSLEFEEASKLLDKTMERSEEGREKEYLYVDYGIAATIYFQVNQMEKAIACNKKALEIVRSLTDKSGISYLLSNLMSQYRRIGDYEKVPPLYEELIETDEIKNNPYGRCAAELQMVMLFEEWGMEDEVWHYMDLAGKSALVSQEPDALLRVVYSKASSFLLRKRVEEAVYWTDSLAVLLADNKDEPHYNTMLNRYRIIESLYMHPGSNSKVQSDARKLLEETTCSITGLSTLVILGTAWAEQGETALAIETYQKASVCIEEYGSLYHQRIVYGALADLYERTKKYDKSTHYHRLYQQAHDEFTNRRNAGLISQFKVKYETREKEQANKLLRAQLELQERTLGYYILAGLCTALAIGMLVLWQVRRYHTLRLRHNVVSQQHEIEFLRRESAEKAMKEQEEQLTRMLTERKELNRKNEELRGLMEQTTAQDGLQELINSFSPRLLSSEEEQEFRQMFAVVYPTFLSHLRERFPKITSSEEVLAMLIRMNMNNQEISLVLGINLASVHTSRSRLRKKLELDKGEVLEEFVRDI